MGPQYQPLEVPFSTADASCPEFRFESGQLQVTFYDWREQPVRLLFHNAAAFSWDVGDVVLDAAHRDDCCYIVNDSPWLQSHLDDGSITLTESHRHFKLCFNAEGVLQVLASQLEVLSE